VVRASRETRTGARRAGAAALAAAAAALLASAPAHASIPSAPQAATPAEVREYWTAERMREAIPADRLLVGVQPPSAPLGPEEMGEPAVFEPRGPAPRSGPLDDLLGTGESGPSSRATLIDNPRPAPLRTHGKVYFTMGALDYVCSGTSITADNKRLVVTAGHCVYGFDRFASQWLFVPAKDGDEEPFGRWTARKLLTTPQWRSNEDIRYDVGMARMAKRDGRRLQRAVGARGIGFNLDPNRYHAYGYPAEAPFPGDRLYLCNSPARGSDQEEDRPRPRRIDCDMTGGSSGGGWVVRERLVNSVVSYGYECTVPVFPCENPEEGKLFGPYFGDTVKQLYRSAQRRAGR
jgi:V8-like Glu-specific endopeptidase